MRFLWIGRRRARTGGCTICKNHWRCKLNEISRRLMNCGCITKYEPFGLSCQMSSGITVCLSCSISRTCSLNNSWWKLEVNFSLPFDFPMLRIARWFPFKCWWASSSSLSENHLQRFALWNLYLEFSGLHYCLFVKVLRCLSRDSLFNISQPSALVNNFFIFFATRSSLKEMH